jgi:tetratricopeptide (TPR) repeat protein
LTSLERDRVPSPRPIASKEVPLVDRIEEMDVLKEAVFRAVHGEGGLVFIHGEAGIGKTRLIRELGAYARSRGVQVLYGRCPALFRMDGVPPYILWKEIIKDYLSECNPEQLNRVIGFYPAEVAKLVPEISQKLRAFPQSFPISPEQEQNRLFEAVSQFITNLSREAPLLVVLDDLQWTDPSSLLLLHYLARGVQETSLLLLGAYRSTDVDDKHPLTPVLTELNRERLLQGIALKRMSLSDVSEMIRSVLEQGDVPAEFCKLVYDKTRGNPFFTEEVVKSLKEEGIIYKEESTWKFKDVSAIEFPKSVKNVLKTRLSRLDDDCQNVLTMASFIGNDFTLEAICAVTGIEEDKLLKLMDKMFKTGLIEERIVRGEGICSFADIMIRDVVYEEVSPLTRKKTHGIVGSALEKVYAKTIDEHLGELALHFLESGQKDKALEYFLKAGERATKVYANSEAASYFQSALKLLEEKEGEHRVKGQILERLGDIKQLVGEYDACMKYWNEASLVWKHLDEKETVARLHRKMANILWRSKGDTEKAKAHHEEALKILEKEPESIELANLFNDMARLYLRTEDVTKARSWAEKALGIAERLNSAKVIADCCLSFPPILEFSGDKLRKAVEFSERALSIALDKGYMETAMNAYFSLSGSLSPEENEKSFELLEKAFDLAKKIGAVRGISWFGTNLAINYIFMGNLNRAISLAEESVALDRKAGNMINLSFSMNELGACLQTLGEWDKSERYHLEALGLAQKARDTQQIVNSYMLLGMLYLDKGEYVKSREQFEKATEACEAAGAKYYLARWVNAMGGVQVYIELGETEKAQNLLDSMLKFAVETNDKVIIAHADALTAMLFRAQRKWKESIELFEKSLQEFEAFNARRWYVPFFARMVLFEYARAYLERDGKGDREKARSLLNQALEIFEKMGAKKDIEKVEARIAFIETGKVVSKPKPTEHVPTGYAELDRLLYGGIPSNRAVVLASPSCNERDMLVENFLETGAKKGEATFYVTIDPSVAKPLAEEFQSNFYLFVCNPEADAIVKDATNVVKLKGVENLTDISIALTSAIRKLDLSLKGAKRICLGLISDILLQHHAVETRRWLTALITKLKSEGFTTLAVMDPEMHAPQEVRAVLDLFDGEINIFEKDSERFLKVKRMSSQKYLESELRLKKEDLGGSA